MVPTPAIALGELLRRTSPKLSEYRSLIASIEFERAMGSLPPKLTHADQWAQVFDDHLSRRVRSAGVQEIVDRTSGQLMLDLGGGEPPAERVSLLQDLAVLLGVSSFISVERYALANDQGIFPAEISQDLGAALQIPQPPQTQAMLVQGDMLEFLAALPDNCCNVTMNGIDGFVVHYPQYHDFVADELARVLLPGGVAFGSNAVPLQRLEARGLENLGHLLKLGPSVSFFRKPRERLSCTGPSIREVKLEL